MGIYHYYFDNSGSVASIVNTIYFTINVPIVLLAFIIKFKFILLLLLDCILGKHTKKIVIRTKYVFQHKYTFYRKISFQEI